MTIKQQGGIFGRNPSFNALEANTAYVANELGVGESNPARVVHIKASVPAIRLEDSDVAGLYHEFLATAGGQFQFKADGGNVQASSTIGMVVDGTLVGTFGSTGFALPSGLGIDFSATSGTGTSELFDDYEEGTWTPTQGNFGTWTAPVFSAAYTKIGRSVTVNVRQNSGTISSGGAGKYIAGLPYAPSIEGTTGIASNGSVQSVSDLLLYSGGNIYFISDIVSQTSLQFSLTYMV